MRAAKWADVAVHLRYLGGQLHEAYIRGENIFLHYLGSILLWGLGFLKDPGVQRLRHLVLVCVLALGALSNPQQKAV